ncbi:hypothetical protein R3P38DRAFT_2781182 [Favolaschia claudopus]|uniref:Uncharacterized protein n=1 Tax=Favolaschia claudopus TaxID=2862362 RepID=A0AAW0B686_9AGAR
MNVLYLKWIGWEFGVRETSGGQSALKSSSIKIAEFSFLLVRAFSNEYMKGYPSSNKCGIFVHSVMQLGIDTLIFKVVASCIQPLKVVVHYNIRVYFVCIEFSFAWGTSAASLDKRRALVKRRAFVAGTRKRTIWGIDKRYI